MDIEDDENSSPEAMLDILADIIKLPELLLPKNHSIYTRIQLARGELAAMREVCTLHLHCPPTKKKM